MKKIFKKINVLGLGLILAGGLAIVSQSAFTAETKATTGGYYAFDQNLGDWVPVDIELLGAEEEGGFTCEAPTENELCTGYFDNPPASPAQSPDDEEEIGIYTPWEANQ